MTARPENEFTTILDMRNALSRLIDIGLGELPVQILVAPDSTVQAIAVVAEKYTGKRPALMIELATDMPTGRIPPSIISTDRLTSGDSYKAVQ